MSSKLPDTLNAQPFTWNERAFVRAEVPTGDNRGKIFTVAQPLAQRYQIVNFFASGGMGLLLDGLDLRTQCRVLIKTTLNPLNQLALQKIIQCRSGHAPGRADLFAFEFALFQRG